MDDHLATGRLHLASDAWVKAARGYHCCLLEPGRNKSTATGFLDWIKELAEGEGRTAD